MKPTMRHLYISIVTILIYNSISAQQTKNVTLQLSWKHQFQFAGYYAAIEKGYYSEVGLSVNLIEAEEGQNPAYKVIEGKADFGVCTSDIILMRDKQMKAVVLATIFQHSPQILIASKKSGINHVHDLAGKRIAMETNAADIVTYMLDEGIPLNKCVIKSLNFNTNELIEGKVDAISAYSTDEPFILNKINFDYNVLSPTMGGIDFYGDILFTTELLIRKDPTLVENFRKASLKGWKYAMENSEEIIQLIYRKYSQRHSLEHLRFEAAHMNNLIMQDIVEIGYSNPGKWESIASIYKRMKMINPSFSINGLLYSDYLKHKTAIKWNVMGFLLLIILIMGLGLYFFYKSNQRLKKEFRNRKKLEKILHESDAKYHILFENSPDAYLILIDGVFVDCNETTEKMFLGNRTQIIGKSPVDLSPEFQPNGKKSLEYAAEMIIKSIQTGKSTFEWVYSRFDGKEIMVEVSLAFMKLDGKPALFSSLRSIDERKQIEEKLKESEKRFKTIFNEAPLGIALIDSLTGHIYEVNSMFAKIAGRTTEEMSSVNWMNITHPDDIKKDLENMALMNAGKISGFQMEKRYIHPDESQVWINMTIAPVYTEDKAHPQHLSMIEDITERKRAEKALSETQAILRAAMDNSPAGIVIVNAPDGVISYLNDTGLSILGRERESIINKIGIDKYVEQWKIIDFDGNPLESEEIPLTRAVKYGERCSLEFIIQRASDDDRILLFNASPIRNEDGKIMAGIAVFLDITERKQVEENLKANETILQDLNADKDQFISILAHDLKNPFNTILGYLDLLTENIRVYNIDKIEKQISIINNSAQSTYNLLLDILMWARSQSGKISFAPKSTSFPEILTVILPETQPIANAKKISVNHVSSEEINVFADIDMLKTILRNLISNSIKYTNLGGSINVKVEEFDYSKISMKDTSLTNSQIDKLSAENRFPKEHYHIISISDDGVGIAPEVLNKLFTVSKIKSTKGTNNESGTGLGLSLCKEFVERHGGTIWAESKPGKGSTFYFTLPVGNIES